MPDLLLTSMTELSAPVLTDITYAVADPGGTPLDRKITLTRLLGMIPIVPGGRLTTESGVPVSATDRTSQGTLYYTPYIHGGLRIWDGTRWVLKVFTEISLSLSVTSGKLYDVFTNNGTSLTLSAEWTSGMVRADAIGTQNGVKVLNSDKTYLWLGTIKASGTNVTNDSGGITGTSQVGASRLVWNAYNQVPRPMSVIDTTDSWSYQTGTIRQANDASGNQLEYVTGDAASMIHADLIATCQISSTSTTANAGIGVDTNTQFSGQTGMAYTTTGAVVFPIVAKYKGCPGLGYHTLAWLEKGAAGSACYFYGDSGSDGTQSGLSGWLMG